MNWNKLNNSHKIMIILFIIGLVLCLLSGIFLGIPRGICPFDFKPMGIILCSVGCVLGLMALFAFAIHKIE